jgi:hypothetical protein
MLARFNLLFLFTECSGEFRSKNVSVQKSNSNPVGLNLQTHMQSVPITTCYEFESPSWRGVLDTTLYVIVCQWLWASLRVLLTWPKGSYELWQSLGVRCQSVVVETECKRVHRVRVTLFSSTFNNISVKLWWLFFVEEIGVPGDLPTVTDKL